MELGRTSRQQQGHTMSCGTGETEERDHVIKALELGLPIKIQNHGGGTDQQSWHHRVDATMVRNLYKIRVLEGEQSHGSPSFSCLCVPLTKCKWKLIVKGGTEIQVEGVSPILYRAGCDKGGEWIREQRG